MKLLAFDSSTQTLGLALHVQNETYMVQAPGGAQASESLIAQIQLLLSRFKLCLTDLDAIAFGCGPGAFTGLRTSCSVAQGLAMGAELPVIPIVTLHAGAQEYLLEHPDTHLDQDASILVRLDARMDEWYWAHYKWIEQEWHIAMPPTLSDPAQLQSYINRHVPEHVVDIATAQMHGMIELAKQAWEKGQTVTAENALPLYLRNKVALTTVERAQLHAQKQQERTRVEQPSAKAQTL